MLSGQGWTKPMGWKRQCRDTSRPPLKRPPDLRALDLSHQPRTALLTDSGPR